VPAGQFTRRLRRPTSEGDVKHPTLGHKTEFQCGAGGSGVPVPRTRPPYKYHPMVMDYCPDSVVNKILYSYILVQSGLFHDIFAFLLRNNFLT